MRIFVPLLISFCGPLCLPAVAAEPPAPASAVADGEKISAPEPAAANTKPTAPATNDSSNPSPSAASKAPLAAANASPSSLQDAANSQDKSLRARGYKPETRGGTTVYCRKEAVLGSRFENKICRSAAELEHDSQAGKDMVQDMQRVGSAGPRSN
jgi:hypothetical protein